MSLRPLTPVLAAIGVFVWAAGVTRADPASVVSLSWNVSGQATAAAAASCPGGEGCEVFGSCSSSPGPSFSESGSTMETYLSYPSAHYGCGFGCNCCTGGAGATGTANASIAISESSSAENTQWNFGAVLSTGASAGTGVPPCGGSASAAAGAQQDWQLTFETEAVRLSFSREHKIHAISNASAATSTITLSGASGTLFSQTLERSTEGATEGDGEITLFLEAGEYTLNISSQLDSAAAAPDGGTISVWARCSLIFSPYVCTVIAEEPQNAIVCSGGTAVFDVEAAGTEPQYRWRLDETDLFDGVTGSGSVISGSGTSMLSIIAASSADNGSYDCVASNECISRTSDAATLTVFDGGGGDGNADTFVDALDVQGMVAAQLSGGPPSVIYCPYDMNMDGTVDQMDIPLFADLLVGL